MESNGWLGKGLLALGVLVAVAGLAVSIYLSASGKSLEVFSDEAGTAGAEYVLTAADFPQASDTGNGTGNQVGYKIPDFTLELVDGSTVTSADLVASGRPTYLFFWATI